MDTPFFSDTVKPYISEKESKALFERVNEIFWKTGFSHFPLILLPFFSIIPLPFIPVVYKYLNMNICYILILSLGPCLLSLILQIGISMYLPNKRKTDLTKLIDEWNRMEGIPKGIYFALGTEHGVSSDDFFMCFVQRQRQRQNCYNYMANYMALNQK